MKIRSRTIILFIPILLFACKNDKFQAYEDYCRLSSNGGFYGESGPYKMNSNNSKYYIISIPFEHVNVIQGDLCSGITKVFESSTDSLLYVIDRYFGVDNTFISNDGNSIIYVNNYWRYNDFDSCSTNVLEFYRKGILTEQYTYSELLGIQPDKNDNSWLIEDCDFEEREWLVRNNRYLIDDNLYLITQKTKEVIIIDIYSSATKRKVGIDTFLDNLEYRDFQENIIEFLTIEEIEILPNLVNGESFRVGLSKALNIDIISTDRMGNKYKYYYTIWIKAKIDKYGNCIYSRVHTNEYVLVEQSAILINQIRSFLKNARFEIETLPYDQEYWLFEDVFEISKRPKEIAESELIEFKEKVCLIDTIQGHYVPFDINDAHKQLDKILDDSSKVLIMNGVGVHWGIGMWLRNNWGLWSGSRLQCYFGKRELYHPDHISGFIISTYQMRLKNEVFNQDSLLKEHSQKEKAWFDK
jgi:hypothetical protein